MASHSSSPPGPGQAPAPGSRRAAGAAAEAAAAGFLESRGLRIVARNFRVRGGEIDLICRDGTAIVFVEVRLRTSDGFGGAAASITAAKQARLVLAARYWLAAHPVEAGRPCRFDCVCADGKHLDWIKDAFAAE